jgi:MYXO-CTERM domain-containing protein
MPNSGGSGANTGGMIATGGIAIGSGGGSVVTGGSPASGGAASGGTGVGTTGGSGVAGVTNVGAANPSGCNCAVVAPAHGGSIAGLLSVLFGAALFVRRRNPAR